MNASHASAVVILLLCAGIASGQATGSGEIPASARDPVTAILDAFESHRIVALSEGVSHGHVQGHDFIVRLISDDRFGDVVDAVVVEWGNSLYQDVIDRYVAGEVVPYRELRQVWQNTTQDTVWDQLVYEEFYRALRLINRSLPKERRLQVLLGDPPIEWQRVRSREEWERFLAQRDSFPARLIADEVVDERQRALVIYGALHLFGRRLAEFSPARDGIVTQLRSMGVSVFNIFGTTQDAAARLQPDISSWQVPRLALIEGTPLGLAPFSAYGPPPIAVPMQELFDAIMVYEPRPRVRTSHLSPSLCVDSEYLEMRLERMPWSNLNDVGLGHCERSSGE